MVVKAAHLGTQIGNLTRLILPISTERKKPQCVDTAALIAEVLITPLRHPEFNVRRGKGQLRNSEVQGVGGSPRVQIFARAKMHNQKGRLKRCKT